MKLISPSTNKYNKIILTEKKIIQGKQKYCVHTCRNLYANFSLTVIFNNSLENEWGLLPLWYIIFFFFCCVFKYPSFFLPPLREWQFSMKVLHRSFPFHNINRAVISQFSFFQDLSKRKLYLKSFFSSPKLC